jgi:hypothetical protein
LKRNVLTLTLAAAISLGSTIAGAQQTVPYQSPSQQPSQEQTPAQPAAPAQQPSQVQTPAQPVAPAQQPSQVQTPAQPVAPAQQPSQVQTPVQPIAPTQQPSPEQTPMTQAPAGPTLTVEGAVIGVNTFSCGQASNSASGTTGIAESCAGVVEIAPGATWADMIRAQVREIDAIPMSGIPVRVLVGPNSELKTGDSTVSLADLKPGSTVKVDYQQVNNIFVATDVSVTALVR